MRKLLVITNHNPNYWSPEQRFGWDNIFYHPFPDIDPEWDKIYIYENIIPELAKVIKNFIISCYQDNSRPYVNLQGEYATCLYLYKMFWDEVEFVFPTTKRETKEVIMPDGSTKKETIFKFVRWR